MQPVVVSWTPSSADKNGQRKISVKNNSKCLANSEFPDVTHASDDEQGNKAHKG